MLGRPARLLLPWALGAGELGLEFLGRKVEGWSRDGCVAGREGSHKHVLLPCVWQEGRDRGGMGMGVGVLF